MKFLVLTFSILATLSTQARANGHACTSVFAETNTLDQNTETHTHNGKARYFTVKHYHRLLESELNNLLKTFRNLTQFSEKLEEINSFTPESDSGGTNEARFIANQIVPLVEKFLKDHGVEYYLETFQNEHNTKTPKKTIFVIATKGQNTLNDLARQVSGPKYTLVVDPLELFDGLDHFNHSVGRSFDMDNHTTVYTISFGLLLRSQSKTFKTSLDQLSHDQEIKELLVDQSNKSFASAN